MKTKADFNSSDPFGLFQSWYDNALKNELLANAMTLSTVSAQGFPSSRVVLLSEYHRDIGFIFYTNYISQKAKEIAVNQHVSLLFFWPKLDQQIRIEGVATKTSSELSDRYFYNRQREKQIAAVISHQSERIEDLNLLQRRYEEEAAKSASKKILRPETWGGYQVKASRFEFWLGSDIRLHTRKVYESAENAAWKSFYLQP